MADKKPQSNVARPIPSTMAANKNPESNEAHPLPPVFPIPLPMPGTNISIREQMTAVTFRHYIINFFGTQIIHVYVTADPFVADCWVNEILHLHHNHLDRLVAGFGVQWNSATYTNSTGEVLLLCDYAATLQICVGKCCLIYQLAHAPYVTALLLRFLQTTTLVGLWNNHDARMLWECKHRMQVRVPLDMTLYVKKENGDNFANSGSLEEIAHVCLGLQGVRMDHEISKMDWCARVLSPEQVRQACVQAYVSFLIGLKHKAWNIVG